MSYHNSRNFRRKLPDENRSLGSQYRYRYSPTDQIPFGRRLGVFINTVVIVSVVAALMLLVWGIGWRRPSLVSLPAVAGLGAARPGALLLGIAGAPLKAELADAQCLCAEEIMRRSHMVDKVTASRSRALITQRDKHGWQRVRDLTAITKLQANGVHNQRVLYFNPPVDVQGMVMLLLERSGADDMWMYLASDGKVRRLQGSNKRDAFAGTEFSLGDLIGYAVDEWRHRIVGEGNIGAESCYIIESVPATESTRHNTGYSKRKSWISKSRFTLLKFEAWDTEGQLLKQVAFGDFQQVDSGHNKWVAMRAHARNVQSGHTTEILFFDYRIDGSMSDALFTRTMLESRRWMLFSF